MLDDVIGCDQVIVWLQIAAALIASHHEELTALDAAIGDADHGVNLTAASTWLRRVCRNGRKATLAPCSKPPA